ncbi:MAG: hypothetical protein KGZ25_08800 [Planctomycetes bacterium]|nr:hypothetical protein [Planctomycetota bacterium]
MRSLAITITTREQAELLPTDPLPDLEADQVRGETLFTLVSPGTELAANYCGESFRLAECEIVIRCFGRRLGWLNGEIEWFMHLVSAPFFVSSRGTNDKDGGRSGMPRAR